MGELLGQTIVVENLAPRPERSARCGSRRPPEQHVPDRQPRHARLQPGPAQEPALQFGHRFRAGRLVTESPRILLARKDLPVNNLQELREIRESGRSACKMQFGSAGVGSGTHLPCELLNATLGVKTTHIPYKGAAPGDAGPDRRPHRLHVRHHPDRRGAGQGGTVKGIAVMSRHHPDHRRACHHRRAGPGGRRGDGVERLLLSEGHAQRDRPPDEQGDEHRDGVRRCANGWRSSASKSCHRSSAARILGGNISRERPARWKKVIVRPAFRWSDFLRDAISMNILGRSSGGRTVLQRRSRWSRWLRVWMCRSWPTRPVTLVVPYAAGGP